MKTTLKQKQENIELSLSVACCVTPKGTRLTVRDLAEICGCSRGTINNIEKSALKKARNILNELNITITDLLED